MRRTMWLAALLILAPVAARAEEIPVDHLSLPVPHGRSVHVSFPVGDFRIETATGDKVEFDLSIKCRHFGERCEERARRVHVNTDTDNGRLSLEVKGPHGISNSSLVGVLRVPKDLALDIDMGVGDLDIDGVLGNLDVNLGVGDATIRTDRNAVRSIDASAGVGDTDVRTTTGRVNTRGFIGSSASWDDGAGRSSITLRVGVGDAKVRVQ